jgi:sugar phosphate isomerase/epimerase
MLEYAMTAGLYHPEEGFFEKEINQLAEAGFACVDYRAVVLDNTPALLMPYHEFRALIAEHKRIMDAAGIWVCQTHGPWLWPPLDGDEETRAVRFEKMKRAIEANAMVGSHQMVVHPLMPQGYKDDDVKLSQEVNREFYSRLAEVGKEYDVVIALENMPFPRQPWWKPAETAAFAASFEHDHIKVCLDTGHSFMMDVTPDDAVRAIGADLLTTLHVHDNDGTADQHLVPFDGKTEWYAFVASLREIGFKGALSLESKVPFDCPDNERLALFRKMKASLDRMTGVN